MYKYLEVKDIKNALKNISDLLPVILKGHDFDDGGDYYKECINAVDKNSTLYLYIDLDSEIPAIPTDYLYSVVNKMADSDEIEVVGKNGETLSAWNSIYLTDIKIEEIKGKEAFVLADYTT